MANKECKKSIAHNPSTRNLDGPLELSVHTLTRYLTYSIWQKKIEPSNIENCSFLSSRVLVFIDKLINGKIIQNKKAAKKSAMYIENG